MRRLPQEELRSAKSLTTEAPQLDSQTAMRLKEMLKEDFREHLTIGAPTNDDDAGLRRLARQIKAKKAAI